LIDNGDVELIRLLESGKIPLTVAAQIATGTSAEIQLALSDAYEKGDLRGTKLKIVRTALRRRGEKREKAAREVAQPEPTMTLETVTKVYREQSQLRRALVKRASLVRDRLALFAAACRLLLADPQLIDILRAQNLGVVAEKLMELTREE
jgi:ParB family transcriptional regulator, chromosome partitioning protein